MKLSWWEIIINVRLPEAHEQGLVLRQKILKMCVQRLWWWKNHKRVDRTIRINTHFCLKKELPSHKEEEESSQIIFQASSWCQVDREKQKKKKMMLLTPFSVWLRKLVEIGSSPYFPSCHRQSGLWLQSDTLTHPDFSKLSSTKPLHQLNGLPWDLPGIFVPRLLWFGTNACLLQSSAQAIWLLWFKIKNEG